MRARVLRLAGIVALALGTGACSWFHFGSDAADADASTAKKERMGLELEADKLLDADRRFAARALEAGAGVAFREFLDANGMRLAATGEPVRGPEAVSQAVAAGPARILSWEPRFAEVFAPGDVGWTWGDWQTHEPGAGGRRLAQGRYVSIWKKEPDGSWNVRMELNAPEGPAP